MAQVVACACLASARREFKPQYHHQKKKKDIITHRFPTEVFTPHHTTWGYTRKGLGGGGERWGLVSRQRELGSWLI
jgi:hypothetical protein